MTTDLFHGIRDKIDFNLDSREKYERRVVSKSRLLDIGGRNKNSKSRRRINLLNSNPENVIISTDNNCRIYSRFNR